MSWLVFDAEEVTLADSTGLEALEKLTKDLRRDEITLVVARLRTRMEEQSERSGLSKTIGPELPWHAVSHFHAIRMTWAGAPPSIVSADLTKGDS